MAEHREPTVVNEKALTKAEISAQLKLYQSDPFADCKEPEPELYWKAECPFSRHILEYLRRKDATEMFALYNVGELNPLERPEWLRGVPTVAAPYGSSQEEMELFVGEEALSFVRKYVEDGSFYVPADEHDDGAFGGSVSVNRFAAQKPKTEAELMNFLLPMPQDKKAVDEQKDSFLSEEEVKKMMKMREMLPQRED